MTHLTATNAATAYGQVHLAGRARSNGYAARDVARRGELEFYSPLANFLELRGAVSHYSVINGLP